MRQTELTAEIKAKAEQSYDQLTGKWLEWLEVAKRFEHKAKAQDRLDLRHTIIIAFADQQARNEKLGKPDLSLCSRLLATAKATAHHLKPQYRDSGQRNGGYY